jgi:hypothetical protein
MWTAVRLGAVCAIALSSVIALRSTFLPAPPAPTAGGNADDIVLVNLEAKQDKLPTVDENETKIVSVERIRLASPLQANAKAEAEPNRETHHKRRIVHPHRHHASRRIRRR